VLIAASPDGAPEESRRSPRSPAAARSNDLDADQRHPPSRGELAATDEAARANGTERLNRRAAERALLPPGEWFSAVATCVGSAGCSIAEGISKGQRNEDR
jgi:hypothetical protein